MPDHPEAPPAAPTQNATERHVTLRSAGYNQLNPEDVASLAGHAQADEQFSPRKNLSASFEAVCDDESTGL